MPTGSLSSIAADAAACTAARFVVRELPGRGRGLVAVGDVASGEQLAAFAAYSHNCDTRRSVSEISFGVFLFIETQAYKNKHDTRGGRRIAGCLFTMDWQQLCGLQIAFFG